MPYASASDAPSYVPAAKKAQWVAVWTSAHAKALKDGKNAKDAEASAFAQANGVVKKESSMFDELFQFDIARVVEANLPMNQSHDELRGQLSKALKTAHGVPADSWSGDGPWVSSVFPSHVVYQHKGQTYKRSYTVDHGAAGTDPTIKLGTHKPVHTAYVESKMDEAETETIFLDVPEAEPIQERYISQATRKGMDKADFAGKGTSFPISKPEDVAAALHSIGRRGSGNFSADELKKRILSIAKRKGFAVPKSDAESVTITLPEGSEVVQEGIAFVGTVNVKESGVSKIPVKLIGPGWGSMAYYPKEVLKRDGPSVFTKGTHMMWNHATDTEEADRPEGNLDNLAAVLTKDAEWKDSGPKGPGLYSEAKVFSDYAQQVSEKGAHIGVSINAAIRGKEGTMEGRTGRIAESFVKAFSTDFVTRAGAGGAPIVPVLESQRGHEETAMTDQEIKERKDLETENATLKARLAKVEESQNQVLAIASVAAVLKEAGVPFRQSLLERACQQPVMKEGKPDAAWVKSVVSDFSEGHDGRVEGFGEGTHTHESEKPSSDKRLKEALKSLGVPEKGLDFAVAGRV